MPRPAERACLCCVHLPRPPELLSDLLQGRSENFTPLKAAADAVEQAQTVLCLGLAQDKVAFGCLAAH